MQLDLATSHETYDMAIHEPLTRASLIRIVIIMDLSRSIHINDYTRVCTYRTVGTVRMSFTRMRTLYSHTIRTVVASYSQLFAHYSHTIRTVAHYLHGRTLFARSHTIRSIEYSLSIPSSGVHYAQLVRAVHTLFAPLSHQIRTLFAPVHTPVTLFARWGRARSHPFTQYSRSSHPFAFANV